MPGTDAFPHGTRARYTRGCRCRPCTASNVARYHARQAKAIALARELAPAPDAAAPQVWTAPDGTRRVRVYRRACPGVLGQPCPLKAHLRRDSKGGCCSACRERLVWDGLVPAAKARAHVLALSRAGVGYKAVAAAADVSRTVLQGIRLGRKVQIRASTEARILDVDATALADRALVPAKGSWRRLRALLDEGFTRTELARQLGSRANVPHLQLHRNRITAINASKVERLYRRHVEG